MTEQEQLEALRVIGSGWAALPPSWFASRACRRAVWLTRRRRVGVLACSRQVGRRRWDRDRLRYA